MPALEEEAQTIRKLLQFAYQKIIFSATKYCDLQPRKSDWAIGRALLDNEETTNRF
jgi:hypothetical protein